MNIKEWLEKQICWSTNTFGPGRRTGGITKHIEKEVEEIRAAPNDVEEWIDVAILALDGAWRCLSEKYPAWTNASLADEVAAMLEAKREKNSKRSYPMPTSQDEPSEHDRSNEITPKSIAALKRIMQLPSAPTSALDTQVGGNHYKDYVIQPVEFCQKNRLGYCESNAIKYVSRHGKKGGRQDIEKAIHYLELLLELEYPKPPEPEMADEPDALDRLDAELSAEKFTGRNAIPHSKLTGIG